MQQQKQSSQSLDVKRIQQISNLLTRMFALLQVKADQTIITEWTRHLIANKYNDEQIAHMYKGVIEDGDLVPWQLTIAKFRNYAMPELNYKDVATAAWGEILKFIRLRGSLSKMPDDFGEATRRAVSSVGGLHTIGDCREDNLSYIRHNFIDAHQAYSLAIKAEGAKQLKEGQ